ncbi:hypothetical protein [Natronoglycomyces albus]|uniref:PH domain-containing protein n=1 Tax=Natronoglycomyces albus TaxID=2811108 RepID=A0A895XTC6_9ACTN|nr:hypothetical protein [Natronoglycomyces albus]QSB06559.1 hypothetical protein JQS30_06565 [Natronoglycomyces albus]
MSEKITFHPTPVQTIGRSFLISIGITAIALIPATALIAAINPDLWWLLPAVPLVAMTATFVIAVRASHHIGIVADDRGIQPVSSSGDHVGRYAPWPMIVDIRAERWRRRIVPVIYLNDPDSTPWRLRAPYSGHFLASDPEIDEKIFILRSMWETYRHDRPPDWSDHDTT